MIHEQQLELPLPPDRFQAGLLKQIRLEGCVVASPGTDRYAAMDILARAGMLNKRHCPRAQGVYQFEIRNTEHL